jgi:hypothetical protein
MTIDLGGAAGGPGLADEHYRFLDYPERFEIAGAFSAGRKVQFEQFIYGRLQFLVQIGARIYGPVAGHNFLLWAEFSRLFYPQYTIAANIDIIDFYG